MHAHKPLLSPTVLFAWKEILPILVSYVVVGLTFGLMVYEAGYSLLWCALCSGFVYAGSLQIVMLPLMISGMPIPALAIMALTMNARYLFYSFGLVERFRGMGRRTPYMVLAVSDETYSVICSMRCPPGVRPEDAYFAVQLSCQVLWVLATSVGYLIGQAIPLDLSGIEFCATGYFIAVVVEQWKSEKSHIPAFIGAGAAALFLLLLGPDGFLLPALAASLLALILLRKPIEAQEAAHE